MTQAGELYALAERCEMATAPSRALDRDIELAVMPERTDPQPHETLATYTGSLDAAMELVGTSWYLGCLTERDEFNQAKACFTEVSEPCRDVVGTAPYLELALCAAALRARAAVANGETPTPSSAQPGDA